MPPTTGFLIPRSEIWQISQSSLIYRGPHHSCVANIDLLALNATASERINFLATEKKPDYRYKPDATNLYTYSIGYVFACRPLRR
jgi:hypothetical protein